MGEKGRDVADELTERIRRSLAERYEILGEAGAGGMAHVFKATELKHGRTVAIKVLRPEIALAVGSERFLREIDIVANLSHPHIVPVHESGEADGYLYYVMPFIDGSTLRDRLLEDRPMELDEVLRTTREVGQALEYAHDRGVIHRDLKPENILIAEGIAVVTDFGVARAETDDAVTNLTATGVAIGTPRYMSPEQINSSHVDRRSDVYSLGCLVYEMLAGTSPFNAPTPIAMLVKHAVEPAPEVGKARADTPQFLADAVGIALAKDPDARFDSVTTFLAALESGVTVTAPRKRRRQWVAWLAAVAGVVVAAALIGRPLQTPPPSPASDEGTPLRLAVLPFTQIGTLNDAFFAEGMTDEISSRIGEFAAIAVIAHSSASQMDPAEYALEEIGQKLNASHVVMGSVRGIQRSDGTEVIRFTPRLVRISDGQAIWSERFDAELTPNSVFDVQSGIAQSVAEALSVTLLPAVQARLEVRPTSSLQAYDSYLRGNLYAAQFLVREDQARAIELYEEATRLDPGFGLAYAELAQAQALYFQLFDPSPARIGLMLEAVDSAAALAPGDPETLIAQGFAGIFTGGTLDDALKDFRAARAQQPSNPKVRWVIGTIMRATGDHESALAYFTEASLIDPRSHFYLFEVLTALFMLRRFDEALQFSDRIVLVAPEWTAGWIAKVPLYLYRGDVGSARQLLVDLSVREGVLDRLVPHMLSDPLYRPEWEIAVPDAFHGAIRELSRETSDLDPADYYYAKARTARHDADRPLEILFLDSLVTVLEPQVQQPPAQPSAILDLAAAYAGLGRREEALAQAELVSAMNVLARERFRGLFLTVDLARFYATVGERERALDELERAMEHPSALTGEFLAIDPAFADLLSEPRFQQLAERR